jgi:hypothetical protein
MDRSGLDHPLALPLCRHKRHADHVCDLPIKEAETFQIGRGTTSFDSALACGENLIIARLRVVPKLAGYIVPDNDWMVFMLPLSWSGEYIFNGTSAERDHIFVAASRYGYSTVGENRHTLTVGVRKASLKRACAALAGNDEDAGVFDDYVLRDGTADGTALR